MAPEHRNRHALLEIDDPRVGLPQAPGGLQRAHGHGDVRDLQARNHGADPLGVVLRPMCVQGAVHRLQLTDVLGHAAQQRLAEAGFGIHFDQHVGELGAADHVEHALTGFRDLGFDFKRLDGCDADVSLVVDGERAFLDRFGELGQPGVDALQHTAHELVRIVGEAQRADERLVLVGPFLLRHQLIGAAAVAAAVRQPEFAALDGLAQCCRCTDLQCSKRELAVWTLQQQMPAWIGKGHVQSLRQAGCPPFGKITQQLELPQRLVRGLTSDLKDAQ